jgi:hypothetical protein
MLARSRPAQRLITSVSRRSRAVCTRGVVRVGRGDAAVQATTRPLEAAGGDIVVELDREVSDHQQRELARAEQPRERGAP